MEKMNLQLYFVHQEKLRLYNIIWAHVIEKGSDSPSNNILEDETDGTGNTKVSRIIQDDNARQDLRPRYIVDSSSRRDETSAVKNNGAISLSDDAHDLILTLTN